MLPNFPGLPRPAGLRLIVLPDPETETETVIIPKKERVKHGTILDVGYPLDNSRISTMEFSKRRRILFSEYAGNEVKVKDKDGKVFAILIMPIESVLAFIS